MAGAEPGLWASVNQHSLAVGGLGVPEGEKNRNTHKAPIGTRVAGTGPCRKWGAGPEEAGRRGLLPSAGRGLREEAQRRASPGDQEGPPWGLTKQDWGQGDARGDPKRRCPRR